MKLTLETEDGEKTLFGISDFETQGDGVRVFWPSDHAEEKIENVSIEGAVEESLYAVVDAQESIVHAASMGEAVVGISDKFPNLQKALEGLEEDMDDFDELNISVRE